MLSIKRLHARMDEVLEGPKIRILDQAPLPENLLKKSRSKHLPLGVFINAGRILRKVGLERAEDYVKSSVQELRESSSGERPGDAA